MKTTQELINEIKTHIRTHLVDVDINHKGILRKITKVGKWFREGVNIKEDLDLASIIVKGSVQINVKIEGWVLVQTNDEGGQQQVSFQGDYNSIYILFKNSDYILDFSEAQFANLYAE